MDLDHLPQFKKRFTISHYSAIYSEQAFQEELAKCQVVCANCHRHRTFMRSVGAKKRRVQGSNSAA